MHSGASVPFLTAVQVPVAQLLHASVQALLQQTPSLQKPLAHSPAAPQTAPLALPGTSRRRVHRAGVAAGVVRLASVRPRPGGRPAHRAASAAASRRPIAASVTPPSVGQPACFASGTDGQSSIGSGTPSPSLSDGSAAVSVTSNVPPAERAAGIFSVPSSTSTPAESPRRSNRRSPTVTPG